MKRRTLVAAAGILAIAGSIPLSALAAEKTIVVGVTAGPHAEIMEVVKRIAEKQGMKIRIVEFNDFVQPNAALVAGDLDINSFQHKPYMDQQNEDRGYKLASAAPTITFPLTYYTRKGYKTLADLPQGARVGIPNDPTNANRALHMLEEQGLVRLNPKAGIRATVLDIIDNAKKLPAASRTLTPPPSTRATPSPQDSRPPRTASPKNAPTAPTPTSSASAPRTSPSPGSPSSSSATTPPKSRHL